MHDAKPRAHRPPFPDQDVTPPKRIIGAEKPVEPVEVTIGSNGGTAFVFSAFSVDRIPDRRPLHVSGGRTANHGQADHQRQRSLAIRRCRSRSIAFCSRTRSIRTTSASTNSRTAARTGWPPVSLDPTQRIVDFSFGNRIALIYAYAGRPNAFIPPQLVLSLTAPVSLALIDGERRLGRHRARAQAVRR